MIARQQDIMDGFAARIVEIADQTAAEERRIKERILYHARIGECQRVREIVERWMTRPVSEVLNEE